MPPNAQIHYVLQAPWWAIMKLPIGRSEQDGMNYLVKGAVKSR